MSQLRVLDDGLWCVDHEFMKGGMQLGLRTTVARLPDGRLWVHSPGPLDQQAIAEIDAVGEVAALVAPNAFHHLFVGPAKEAWPSARIFGPAVLASKKTNFTLDEALTDVAPDLWQGAIEALPMHGLRQLDEWVFYHRASRTLLLTDLAFHICDSPHWFTRFFMTVNGKYNAFGPSRIFRLFVQDKALLRASLDRLMAWDFDRVTVTHGRVLETGGKEAMQREYAWV